MSTVIYSNWFNNGFLKEFVYKEYCESSVFERNFFDYNLSFFTDGIKKKL